MKKRLLIFTFCTILTVFAQAKQAVHFSSQESLRKALVEKIKRENTSIRAAVFIFTDPNIANEIVNAKKRGVDVELVLDCSNAHKCKALQNFIDEGIKTYLWMGNEKQKPGIMHHKFCVFHHEALWNGSFNFTKAADSCHRENVICLDNKKLAKAFEEEFERLKQESILQKKT